MQWSNRQVDVSGVLQQWIDQLPVGATLELPAGKYLVNDQIVINQRITLTSIGKSLGDPACDESAGDCAELIATRGTESALRHPQNQSSGGAAPHCSQWQQAGPPRYVGV